MIEQGVVNEIKKLLKNDCTGHDYFHISRVADMAKYIAEIEGANVDVTVLAALLHDVDDVKLFSENDRNAIRIMNEYGYSEEVQTKVLDIIGQLSFKGSGSSVPGSLEGRIVQDADRLDAIGAVGIARAFAYGGNRERKMYDPEVPPREHMDEGEYRSKEGTTINHFYEKLLLLRDLMNTQTAKNIAEKRHKFMLQFLKEFYTEWNGDDK